MVPPLLQTSSSQPTPQASNPISCHDMRNTRPHGKIQIDQFRLDRFLEWWRRSPGKMMIGCCYFNARVTNATHDDSHIHRQNSRML